MANFYAYWFELRRQNPSLNESQTKMTITVGSFEEQLKRAYEAGFREGKGPPTAAEQLFRKFGL